MQLYTYRYTMKKINQTAGARSRSFRSSGKQRDKWLHSQLVMKVKQREMLFSKYARWESVVQSRENGRFTVIQV